MSRSVFACLVATALLTTAANAAQTSLQIEISADQDFQRHIITYDCADEAPMAVTYINAAPNFLALVPIPEETEALVFASVMSASGARYASGKWVWWSKGADAELYDTTLGDDAEPVLTCSELVNTP